LRHARQRRGQEVRHGLHRQRHLALALVLVHPVIAAGDDRGRDSGVGGRLDGLSDGQHYNANVNRSGTWEQPTRAGCATDSLRCNVFQILRCTSAIIRLHV
jgi:hypothetical protein